MYAIESTPFSTFAAVAAAPFLFAVISFVPRAQAQRLEEDPAAPALSVHSDPETPYYSVGLTTDPVGMFLGDYALRVDVAFDRVHALYVEPRWLAGDTEALGIELAYRLFPLGDGLSGPFAALAAGVSVAVPDAPEVSIWGGVDLGWQWIWQGIVLGASGGVGWLEPLSDQDARGLVARVSLALGYAFM